MPTRLARAIDRPIVRNVWAVALAVAAFLLRQVIIKIFGVELPAFITFYPAVMLAALLTGLWTGLLVTLLAAMMAAYWIFPPIGSFAIADKSQLVTFAFFVGTGIFLSFVAERYRQGQKQVAIHKEQKARREGDDKLRQSEQQFEALANSIPQLCWMANSDGWIFWYNRGWYEYTGTTPEQMEGWAWQSVHNPDTLPKVLERWKASLATANPFEMVLPLKGKDGEFRLFLTRAVPVMDASGKVVRWFGTNTDIDDQMQIETALRSSNSRLDLALEVAGMGEWELDLKNHTASRSPRHEQIFGYRGLLSTWTYEMFLDHVVPEHRAEVQEKFTSSLDSGVLDIETQIRRTDGEIRWIWVRGRAVLDDTGEPIRMYGIVMDINQRKQAEEAQTADRAKLDAALASMTDAVLIADVSGQFIKFNDAFAAFCRFNNKAECSTRLSELRELLEIRTLEEELVPLDARPIPRSLRGEVDTNVEYKLTRTDTGETWIGSYSFSPIRDSVGAIIGSVMVVRDITERKRTEESIQKLNRIYAVLSDINQTIVREKNSQAMLETVCRIAVEKGKFRMAWIGMFNPATQGLEPIASSGIVDGYLDFKRVNMQNPAQTGGPSGRSFLSGQHAVCNDIEHDPLYLPWRDEALRRGFRSSGAFPLEVDGRVIGVFTLYANKPAFFDDEELVLLDEMAMDISFALEVNRHEEGRRKAEEELRWRTAFFEAQMESALDGIMVVDRRGKIILQNRRVYDLWKIPVELIETGDDARQVEFVTSSTKNPHQFAERVEYLYSHPDEIGQDEVELLDGTILDRYTSPVKDKAGTYYGRIWIFHDITKQRQLEAQFRQSQKMEAVGQLTGGIAHDFNNLLGVIMGNLDLLERAVPDNAVALKRVQTALKATSRGADLTRRLLAFSSNVELKPAPTPLHHCIRNVMELARTLGPEINITTQYRDSMPLLLVDAAGLENALLNLAVNARDAMPRGGTITISTELSDLEASYPPVHTGELKAGRYALISVSDTGEGMSKQTLERVFEPFFTTKPQGKGTGLGLAMVYGFVKQSGGAVRIYSELGYGTTVSLYLPLAENAAPVIAAVIPGLPPPKMSGSVLVVDDEVDLLDIGRAYLEEMGYTVYHAKDGASALALVERLGEIDLMVTDIVMPGGMNGVELAREIRQLIPQIGVIYCSGFPANSLAERSMAQVDAPLLHKPFHRAEFGAIVRQVMERHDKGNNELNRTSASAGPDN